MRCANKIIVVMILSTTYLFGFVQTRTESGAKIQWPGFANDVELFVDPNYTTCSGSAVLSQNTVNSIIDKSISEWNGHGDISISRTPTTTFATDRNDLYFISKSNYTSSIGSSVLAVTEVTTNTFTGSIQEADVIIFNDQTFTTSMGMTTCFDGGTAYVDNINSATNSLGGPFYLADIITHEIGHMFGLGHSQTHNSTMLYLANKGAYTTEEDDQLGLASIYPSTDVGEITGTIIGSNSLTAVFGAYVSAISHTTGKVVQSVVSDTDGSFRIQQLPIDDTYYLFINPININGNLSDYYTSAQKAFCSNNADYVGSFFRKCGASQRGKPQGISLTSSDPNISTGPISIRCSFDTPNRYSSGSGIVNSINPVQADDSIGEAVTGFFLDSDILANTLQATLNDANARISDKYEVDLTSFDISDRGWTMKDLYLDIKIVSQGINAHNRFSVFVDRVDGDATAQKRVPTSDFSIDVSTITDVQVLENDHAGTSRVSTYDFDYVIHAELDETTTTNNIFDIEIIPQPVDRDTGISSEDIVRSSTLGTGSVKNTTNSYMMILTISEKIGSKYVILESKSFGDIEDNTLCPDAQNTFAVSANISDISREPASDDDDQTAALLCGSIDSSGGNNGQANMWIIFLMSLILFATASKSSKKSWISDISLS